MNPVNLTWSDASLFGLLVQDFTAEGLKEAGTAAVPALKATAMGIALEALTSAITKAKFAAASATDTPHVSDVWTIESKALSDLYISSKQIDLPQYTSYEMLRQLSIHGRDLA